MLSDPAAIANLSPLLSRTRLETQLKAIQILTLMDTPEPKALLNEMLRIPVDEIGLSAAGALLLRGEASDTLVPALARLRRSSSSGVATEASRLLAIAQGRVPIAPPDSISVSGVNDVDFLVVDFWGEFGQRAYSPEAEYDNHVVLGLQCAPDQFIRVDIPSLYYSFVSRWPW